MKNTTPRLSGVFAFLCAATARFGQAIPVAENLWRLVAQEDTDGDHGITMHDRTAPFEVRDKNGAAVRTVEDVYRLSVLAQEVKARDCKGMVTERYNVVTGSPKAFVEYGDVGTKFA